MALTSNCCYALNLLLIISFTSWIAGIQVIPIPMKNKKLSGNSRDSLMNFTELTGKYGYLSEEHRIVTEDGYILTVFRIVRAKNCLGVKKEPPVILTHGLLQSSDLWIDPGPSAGLAYLIADSCHDLWLGNTRGNYYSRKHVLLDPDRDAAYWQFSVDEIGYYDSPALINYVLNKTKTDKVNYIGFSQGAEILFVMCSERPGYCEKVNLAIALSPVVRQTIPSSIYFRTLMKSISDLESVLSKLGIYEVFSKGDFIQELIAFFCQFSIITKKVCAVGMDLLNSLNSIHPGSVTDETIENLFRHFPAGTSVHNIAKYAQKTNNNRFAKFDYGVKKNLELYGSMSTPEYNLSAVTIPVMIIYGNNDGLVDPKDIEWLVDKLPRVLEAVLVEDPLWNHLDFMFSQYIREMTFPKINKYLAKYSYD